jgi:hypothetical protein
MPRPNSQSVAGARKHCRVAISKKSISAPSPNRSPLKVNVYEFAKDAATTLAPLFPYFDAGSIVPCLSVFRGGPGRRYGRFQHFDTVDEVILMFSNPAGLVSVGPKLHMVAAPFDDPDDPATENPLPGGSDSKNSVDSEKPRSGKE